MKLNIRAFCLASVIIVTLPSLLLFVWCAVTGFGSELVRLFESVHPSGGLSIIANVSTSFTSCIPGIAVNTLYAAADSFIGSMMFVLLYNFLAGKFEK